MSNSFPARQRTWQWGLALAAAAGLFTCTHEALAQALQRAAFVGNNGNIEGSVTSFRFTPEGHPQQVQHLILGSGSSNTANNVYALALSQSGRYLATTHATGLIPRLIHIIRINEDASMTVLLSRSTPESPLDAVWIDDEYLAVTLTNVSLPNRVIVYRFIPPGGTQAMSLNEVGRWDTGSFNGYLALSPSRQYLYADNSPWSGSGFIRVFKVEAGGQLSVVQTEPTFTYTLGLSVTPNGRWLYAGGGTSSTENLIPAYNVDATSGTLSWLPGSPFVSPGSVPSPKQAVATDDSRFLFVGHGRSATVRSFAIDQDTGALTDTGNFFGVGIQGDLGNIAILGDLLLFTRQWNSTSNPAGLFSFTIQPNGSFTYNALAPAGGTRPFDIAVWAPPEVTCYANCDGSTQPPILNVEDFTCFINEFAVGLALPPAQQLEHYANCDGSTQAPILNVEDFTCFITQFAAGCP
jgi:6-phosphogluconolactonase (cycloisomerase 2 family)